MFKDALAFRFKQGSRTMKKLLSCVIAVIGVSVSFGDVLVDDFEGGTSQNKLGWHWYYFSDVKDHGNSKIFNATEQPDGSYSRFSGDTLGYNSSLSGKLEFALGDTEPTVNDSKVWTYSNFAGMGTDLARPGQTTDLSGALGIRFMAKADDSVALCCELVTSTIYDNGYYHGFFHITNEWKQYTVIFIDTGEFVQPRHAEGPGSIWPEIRPLDLSKAQKINWKAYEWDDIGDNTKRFLNKRLVQKQFRIDNIYITGINSIPGQTSVTTAPFRPVIHVSPGSTRTAFDCLGRSIAFMGKKPSLTATIFLWQTPQGSRADVSMEKNIRRTGE
jgi:hypothetical protein